MNASQLLRTGCLITPLPPIHHPDGDILHCLKSSDKDSFFNFGEAYFSSIYSGRMKGWKQHQRMIMNLVVPVGRIQFSIYDEKLVNHDLVSLGVDCYSRLTIPPLCWVAFRSEFSDTSLLLNIASIPHDPQEAINKPFDFLEFNLS